MKQGWKYRLLRMNYFCVPLKSIEPFFNRKQLKQLNYTISFQQLSAAAAAADSVYDKLRMFNGQAAAAAGWAWYGATAAGTTPHLVRTLAIDCFELIPIKT